MNMSIVWDMKLLHYLGLSCLKICFSSAVAMTSACFTHRPTF